MKYITEQSELMHVSVLEWLSLEETDADVPGNKLRDEEKADCSLLL